MRNSSPISRQPLAGLVVGLLVLFGAQMAWASKPLPMLGQNHKIAMSAYSKQNTHEALTAEEAEFWKEKLEYDAIGTKLWPLCFEKGSTDVAPDCKTISEAELKASYPDTTIGGLGARYRVSKEQSEVLRQRKIELEKKWSGK